jgi:hypothetical protein
VQNLGRIGYARVFGQILTYAGFSELADRDSHLNLSPDKQGNRQASPERPALVDVYGTQLTTTSGGAGAA